MSGPVAALLPCGTRLHLQHGPIDLVIGAEGDRAGAFAAAQVRFATILEELVAELPLLRSPAGRRGNPRPTGATALRMCDAVAPHAAAGFVTPMAAVAGSVADTILAAMVAGADLRRAYVNNGGDIALHLAPGATFRSAMARIDGHGLGTIEIGEGDGVGGIATSGRHGRSLSMGVADSVTVLASTAAAADAAATLIANAVDLPGHPAVRRAPASTVVDDSDLGGLPVVTGCAVLSASECARALQAGQHRAEGMRRRGLIHSAALFLQGHSALCGGDRILTMRILEHA